MDVCPPTTMIVTDHSAARSTDYATGDVDGLILAKWCYMLLMLLFGPLSLLPFRPDFSPRWTFHFGTARNNPGSDLRLEVHMLYLQAICTKASGNLYHSGGKQWA